MSPARNHLKAAGDNEQRHRKWETSSLIGSGLESECSAGCSQQQDQVWLCSPCLQETCWSSSSITCNSFLPADATTCLTLTRGSVHLHCHRLSRQAWSHISPLHLMFTVATVGNIVSGFFNPFINCHQASDSPFLHLKIGKNVNLPQLIIEFKTAFFFFSERNFSIYWYS